MLKAKVSFHLYMGSDTVLKQGSPLACNFPAHIFLGCGERKGAVVITRISYTFHSTVIWVSFDFIQLLTLTKHSVSTYYNVVIFKFVSFINKGLLLKFILIPGFMVKNGCH